MSFSDDLRKHTEKVQKLSRDAFVDVAIEVHDSVRFGSELTGAPGQPADTSYLLSSWLLGFGDMPPFTLDGSGPDKDPAWSGGIQLPSFTMPSGDVVTAYIVTNTKYAPVIEDGLVQAHTRKAHTRTLENGTTVNVRAANVYAHSRIGGGNHSVKLTRAGFRNIVDHVVERLAT